MYEITIKNTETGKVAMNVAASILTVFASITADDGREGVATMVYGADGELDEVTKHYLGVFKGLKSLREESLSIRFAMDFVDEFGNKFDGKAEKFEGRNTNA